LGQIAGNFDNYEIHKLKFHFRTACSTLEKGMLIMAYEPNPDGTAPTSYQEMRNMHSVDGTVHANLTFDVTPKVRGKKLLTRKGPVFSLPNYDLGKVYLSTIGCTQDTVLGFVDVEYVVRLTNPQSSSSTSNYVTPTFPNPVVQLVWNNGDLAAYTDDVWTNSAVPFSRGFDAGTVYGATSLATIASTTFNVSAFNQLGARYNESTVDKCFFIPTSGRYRFTVHMVADWQDLRCFSILPFVKRGGATDVARYAVMKSVGVAEYALVECQSIAFRGFSGVAAGDPNPATDIPAHGSWELQLQSGDFLTCMVGVRVYNFTQPVNSTVKYASGLGPSWARLEYLGTPVPV